MIRRLLLAILLAVLGYALWWLFFRSTERQIADAQAAFLATVEDRDWDDVKAWFTADFVTYGGLNRDTVMPDLQQALGGFATLDIEARETTVQAVKDQGISRPLIRVTGLGTQIAIAVREKANSLRTPWVFHWRKTGGWPWEWQLTQVHHDEL